MSSIRNDAFNRREFLARTATAGLGMPAISFSPWAAAAAAERGKPPRALFDGKTLAGWRAAPRLQVPKEARFADIPADKLASAVVHWYEEHKQQDKLKHIGRWEVVEGRDRRRARTAGFFSTGLTW